MPIRILLLVLALAVLAAFVLLNWTAFTAPTALFLVFGSVQAPLGLIMLLVTGVIAAAFIMYAMYLQATMLLETRRMSRELESQRKLADATEGSRFTTLQGLVESHFSRLDAAARIERERTIGDAERVVDELRLALDQAANGLAAQIAELDQRLGAAPKA